jgi:para-nitrobenzyl esterase
MEQQIMSTTLVETIYGKVQGLEQGAITVWKGIPFAQPPTGQRRFLPPQPLEPWSTVLDATQFGPTSLQSASFGNISVPDAPPTSEDCLSLNIWSPDADQQKRPVMVYIHGGAFVIGSGSESTYDGTSFATQHDIVVVTCNYRLGLLGLLYLGDLAGDDYAQGNCALLDQIAALQWVHDNIAAFGGDPDNVTVMGESAGAMFVGNLLAMPAARGLFQRAILESGASSSSLLTRDQATSITQAVLKKLDLQASQVLSLIEVPAETLLNVQSEVASEWRGGGAYAPVIDGVTLPKHPLELIAEGVSLPVPLLIGSNRDEWRLFTILLGGNVEDVKAGLSQTFGAATEHVHEIYTKERADQAPELAWIDMQGDKVFRIPAIRQAEAQVRQGAPVWMYRFDWASPAFEGQLGACHAIEMPFVWNILDNLFTQFLLGDAIAQIQPLIDRIHGTWAAFIRTGNPNTAAFPDWPHYDLIHRPTMILNDVSQVVENPQAEILPLWDTIS